MRYGGGELAVCAVQVAVGLVVQRVHVVRRGRAHRGQLVRGCGGGERVC